MLFDHLVEIVRHGKDVALLALEQLKLLEVRGRDVRHHALKSFLAVHEKETPSNGPGCEAPQGDAGRRRSLVGRGFMRPAPHLFVLLPWI